MEKLNREFYGRDTVEVAKDLLGKYLIRRAEGQLLIGQITETEAYIGRMDKACHAYHYLRTPRTEVLFGQPGHAYVYLIYGIYHCLNLVTEPEGEPAAVLLRGIRPVYNLRWLCRLRYGKEPEELTPYQRKNFANGPGKLCQALAVTKDENGLDLLGDELFVCAALPQLGLEAESPDFHTGPRIGIDYAEEAVDFPWRFWTDERNSHAFIV